MQNLSVFLFYCAITYIWEKSGLTFPRIYVLMNLKYQEKKKKEKKKKILTETLTTSLCQGSVIS